MESTSSTETLSTVGMVVSIEGIVSSISIGILFSKFKSMNGNIFGGRMNKNAPPDLLVFLTVLSSFTPPSVLSSLSPSVDPPVPPSPPEPPQ